ncbi:MAG: ATP-binding protein [Elusimicrobiota bacterium]
MSEKILRDVIRIDEDLCNGCGDCVPACPEGAIQIIDGKARLVSDLFCDGLGACLGECPVDAITVEKRPAEPFDERATMANILKQGMNTVKAHLKHLKKHGEEAYLKEALDYLKEKGIENPLKEEEEKARPDHKGMAGGCPGARVMDFGEKKESEESSGADSPSRLRQWPVQLHLVPPRAPYFKGADVVLAADCVAYALGNFHSGYLKGKSLAIACPKLDENQDIYEQKLTSMVDDAKINTLTVMIMEVPCCRGLVSLAQRALEKAGRKIPLKSVVVGINGSIKNEQWL